MASREYRVYASRVVAHLDCDTKTRKRIKEDIIEMLLERSDGDGVEDPIRLLGEPLELALEFRENLDDYLSNDKSGREFISSVQLFGLPLYHIIIGNGWTVAKGIIAIGPRAIGVVAIGGMSVGVISIGGIAVGLLATGGLAVGALIAIGGMAIGYDVAIGGMAVANSLAIGGYAQAKEVAVGGVTSAKLMAYSQSYRIPKVLDEGSAFAYDMDYYLMNFKDKFHEIYTAFGEIKTLMIDLMTGGRP